MPRYIISNHYIIIAADKIILPSTTINTRIINNIMQCPTMQEHIVIQGIYAVSE